MKFGEVNNSNKDLAIKLQAILFPSEKSPKQVIRGIKTNNPKNFIAYRYNKSVGIVGYYFERARTMRTMVVIKIFLIIY